VDHVTRLLGSRFRLPLRIGHSRYIHAIESAIEYILLPTDE
jgi:hypothetical protein